MLKISILEGPRGAGKSTVAQMMRHKIEGSTLINPTGFKEDGDEGLAKSEAYYEAWSLFLSSIQSVDQHLIFDRFFFSEIVYSRLYKSYDASDLHKKMCKLLSRLDADVTIYFLTTYDEDVLAARLNRDKIPLFDQVQENIHETLKQQRGYEDMFSSYADTYGNDDGIDFIKIDTSALAPADVFNIIMKE